MSPTVSIMMNCFNGATYLQKAIESITAQTYKDWELVFWDNRSTDASAEIVATFADERIKYYLSDRHTELGEARRLALAKCGGAWVGFLDCDDLWKPTKLERQMAVVNNSDVELGFVYCRTALMTNGTGAVADQHPFRKFAQGLPKGNIYSVLLRGNYISLPSLLVNRRALDQIGGFSGRFPIMEDYYMSLNIARKFTVTAVDETLCIYRLHGQNASLRLAGDTFEDLRIVCEQLPEPRAVLAGSRIVGRHIKKCMQEKRLPDIKSMFRALT